MAAAIEDWADAIRSRDPEAVCRLTLLGEGAARQTLAECVADIRRSQEFDSSPHFEVTDVHVQGDRAGVKVTITEEQGDDWPHEAGMLAIRTHGRWKLKVPSR